MPATKKKTKRSGKLIETKIAKLSDQMNALLVIFAIGMMMLAYVLIKMYT